MNLSTLLVGVGIAVTSLALGCVASGDGSQRSTRTTTPAGLISRGVLFGNPDHASPRVSPDGTQIAFLAPLDGVMNIFVAPVSRPDQARPLTREPVRGLRSFQWAFTSKHILYPQDDAGDENFRIFAVDLATGTSRNLTPIDSIAGPDGKPIMLPSGKALRPTARIQHLSPKFPTQALIALNSRDPRFHDIFRIDLLTAERALVQQNPNFSDFVTDDDFNIRLAGRPRDDAGRTILRPQGDRGPQGYSDWKPWIDVSLNDASTTAAVAFDRSGQRLYMTDSRDRDTSSMVEVSLDTGFSRVLAQNPKADAGASLFDPATGRLQAVAFNHLRTQWQVLDPAIQPALDALRAVSDGDISITSRSLDDKVWTVAFLIDDGPTRFFLFDRAAGRATFLFNANRALANSPLQRMHPLIIKSRDGLEMTAYLTLPPGSDPDGDARPAAPVPMVLNVHGGPWARDAWGFNSEHQWLANRGYAVLSVNFRGSTGFGKAFLNAGNREWAAKMHDDLLDAVKWAVDNNIALKDKVAIYGGSYGGYAALVGATFTPEVFAAHVAVVGPSNLVTLLNTIPPYWASALNTLRARVGDNSTPEGRAFLESRSPLFKVDQIQRPLLVAQGANDPRVKQSESDQIIEAMQRKNIPVTYALFPDEGHGFVRPENRLAFYALAEAFLAQHLGGKAEPVGDDFAASSMQLPTGADAIPGLPAVAAPTGSR